MINNRCEVGVEWLRQNYIDCRDRIKGRLHEFKTIAIERDEERALCELIFCLLTPQSKAKLCWRAVESICKKYNTLQCSRSEILGELYGVRFRYKKSIYVYEAIRRFIDNGEFRIIERLADFNSAESARDWLVTNIKGLGYKEASHFLRNIGMGDDIAILDRHILRNLMRYGVIDSIPTYLSKKRYIDIEDKMRLFSKNIGIPMSHLDLLFWYIETGELFK